MKTYLFVVVLFLSANLALSQDDTEQEDMEAQRNAWKKKDIRDYS
jgi:hypothetical protein